MTRRRNKKLESTPPPKDAERDNNASQLTGEALIKVMQDPRARDLEFEHPRTPARTRRVKI
jgi:hypothetical protein